MGVDDQSNQPAYSRTRPASAAPGAANASSNCVPRGRQSRICTSARMARKSVFYKLVRRKRARLHNMRPNIVPVLQYDDAPAAGEWLVRALGFAEHGRALKFGPNPVIVRPIAQATGAWHGVRQGLYISAPGASDATKQDLEGHVWSLGAD